MAFLFSFLFTQFLCIASLPLGNNHPDSTNPLVLWYNKPAAEWVEALPIGNGRLGGMVFGNTSVERLQLNEESLWGGSKTANIILTL
jgi:alpha-L-fucosidase 2